MSCHRTIIRLSTVLAVVALAQGCGDGESPAAPPTPEPARPTTVTVSPATDELTALGATVQLTAEVRDQNARMMAGATVTWSSGDTSVATVDASGLVTATGNGTATIAASAGSASGSAVVTVTQSVASVEVSPSVYELTASGATVQLTAEALDGNGHGVAGAEFSWESSDVAVATVDASGLVTAVRGGNATITATYEEITAESVISVWISTLSAVSVRVLYVVPADREFRDDYSDGISRAIVDVQGWYRRQLDGLTFDIYRVIPEQCHLPRDEDYYSYGDVWEKVLEDVQSCAPVQHGPSQFTWALYVDVTERCGEPHELGRGGDGLTMLQTDGLHLAQTPETTEEYRYCADTFHRTFGGIMGGLAHELGHTFRLPHPPGCDEGLPTCDYPALMWDGFNSYPDTYLRDDEKAILRRSPFFKR